MIYRPEVRLLALLIVVAGAFAGMGLTRHREPVVPVRRTRVTLLGDSLTVRMQQNAPLDAVDPDIELVGLTRERTTAFPGFTSLNLAMVLKDVPQPPTDVVLLMIGTNDLLGKPEPTYFGALLRNVHADWPQARVFIAPVPPTKGPTIPESERAAWNAGLAKAAEAQGARVLPDLRLKDSDYLPDTVHLNRSGYEKMRARWLAALESAR